MDIQLLRKYPERALISHRRASIGRNIFFSSPLFSSSVSTYSCWRMDPRRERRPIAYLTRKAQISCCHRLNSLDLSEKENKRVFGKCNNVLGHGHNYTVEVTVRGPVDPITGMVMNLEDLKNCMHKVLMDEMDHKNIDKEVDYFYVSKKVSTTENVAIYIFDKLKTHMSNPELLYEVKVHETDKNVMCFRGEYENVSP